MLWDVSANHSFVLVNLLSNCRYIKPLTDGVYENFAKQKGFAPQTVKLNHGALGSWIGNKDAKNIIIYYHGKEATIYIPVRYDKTSQQFHADMHPGGGFAIAANPSYFTLFSDIMDDLNSAGKDVAFFVVTYSLIPGAVYPTQIKQAVEALRYIVHDCKHAPSDVLIAGDSAGGHLTFNVLSHISHPHPQIEPLELSENLGGAVAIAPWVSFSADYVSMKNNLPKDILIPEGLKGMSDTYRGDAEPDNYNEPLRAPADWWRDMRVGHVLVVAGGDEVLLDGIEEFVKKLKSVFPNTNYLVAEDEPHIAPILHRMLGDTQETQQGKEIRSWLSARL